VGMGGLTRSGGLEQSFQPRGQLCYCPLRNFVQHGWRLGAHGKGWGFLTRIKRVNHCCKSPFWGKRGGHMDELTNRTGTMYVISGTERPGWNTSYTGKGKGNTVGT